MRCRIFSAVQVIVFAAMAVAATIVGDVERAVAAPHYAAFVMDARTGKVLYARNANARLYPASLTKMMTLYLTFEALRDGRLRLNQKVRISAHAAGMQPSRIGLRAGQLVTINQLIHSAAIKSANDAAVALAEANAGSEVAFAKRMTAKAHQIGMSRTTFKNASGLTAHGQRSTAHDMATLGRRLFYDFPKRYAIFKHRSTRFGGHVYRATNRKLLGRYPGADGIKTGYTGASGFNLVGSADHNGKRIIAAVFGMRSSNQRTKRMAHLLDMGFARAPAHVPGAKTLMVRAAPRPAARPETRGGGTALANAAKAIGRAIATPAIASESTDDLSDAPYPLPRPNALHVAPIRKPGRNLAATEGEWAVQVGAYTKKKQAQTRLSDALMKDVPVLNAAYRAVEPSRTTHGMLYRARFTGLDQKTAQTACLDLSRSGMDCIPVPPTAW